MATRAPDDDPLERLLTRSLDTRAAAPGADDCPDAEVLAAWVDRSLPPTEQQQVEGHFADCARCQMQLAAMARTLAAGPATEPRRARFHLWPWVVPVTAGATAVALLILVRPDVVPVVDDRAPQAERPISPFAHPAEAPSRADAPAQTERDEQSAGVVLQDQSAPTAARAQPAARESRLERGARAAPAEGVPASEDERQAAAETLSARTREAPPASKSADLALPQSLAENVAFPTIRSPDPAFQWRVAPSGVERSTDGGDTWQSQAIGVAAELTAGSAPAPTVCWLVGRRGIVLVSSDGGTWRRVPFPETVDLIAVVADDARTATVTTADGRRLATADGGATWTPASVQDFEAAPF